jgi:L-alanine-DL-glutamate epimerase-like enolase superfamily enzyme
MKVSAIRPWIIQVPWSERQGGEGPFLTSDNKRELLYTQIYTDEGITGWGEVTTYPLLRAASRYRWVPLGRAA